MVSQLAASIQRQRSASRLTYQISILQAGFSLTQALRALLAAQGVRVQAVLAGPVDTDMSADLAIPKASARSVASARNR